MIWPTLQISLKLTHFICLFIWDQLRQRFVINIGKMKNEWDNVKSRYLLASMMIFIPLICLNHTCDCFVNVITNCVSHDEVQGTWKIAGNHRRKWWTCSQSFVYMPKSKSRKALFLDTFSAIFLHENDQICHIRWKRL